MGPPLMININTLMQLTGNTLKIDNMLLALSPSATAALTLSVLLQPQTTGRQRSRGFQNYLLTPTPQKEETSARQKGASR